jgi:hypothetical protein
VPVEGDPHVTGGDAALVTQHGNGGHEAHPVLEDPVDGGEDSEQAEALHDRQAAKEQSSEGVKLQRVS